MAELGFQASMLLSQPWVLGWKSLCWVLRGVQRRQPPVPVRTRSYWLQDGGDPGRPGNTLPRQRGQAERQISLEAMVPPSQRVASEVGFEGGVRFGQTKLEGRAFWVGEKWFLLLDEGVTIYSV